MSDAALNHALTTQRRIILGVGIATLDLINEVDAYPAEDAEIRALSHRRARGGNVTNSLSLLAQFGHRCRWAGTLADDPASASILDDLARHGIDTSHAVRIPNAVTPTSCIALSRATGSRTIVHYRDLPELDATAFASIPLDGIDWVHFEGRNPTETRRMIARVLAERPDAGLSLELEKPRPGMADLLHGPRVLLASRAYARAAGFTDPVAFLDDLMPRTSATLCVVAWGAEGACYLARGGMSQLVAASPPERIVDTLGAGDCFNAGVIDGLLRGLPPGDAVECAVRLAGYKCGRYGFAGLIEEVARSSET
ncbi:ketohexokinase [Thiocystis minor]|uniref:PfkB family carbohydrate kinase n=1 Tax=Thiocystis minor TaxID=61597 RepID=UPI0019149167|nr:PfkB family carbohydrate kinase [Thiocystis minor]MBK5966854.1 ketohexokinase [Thiocystis minor]